MLSRDSFFLSHTYAHVRVRARSHTRARTNTCARTHAYRSWLLWGCWKHRGARRKSKSVTPGQPKRWISRPSKMTCGNRLIRLTLNTRRLTRALRLKVLPSWARRSRCGGCVGWEGICGCVRMRIFARATCTDLVHKTCLLPQVEVNRDVFSLRLVGCFTT